MLTVDLSWMDRAACLSEDPELFFPPPGAPGRKQGKAAIRVCWDCPVITQCRSYATSTYREYGVWGGLSETERRRLPGLGVAA